MVGTGTTQGEYPASSVVVAAGLLQETITCEAT